MCEKPKGFFQRSEYPSHIGFIPSFGKGPSMFPQMQTDFVNIFNILLPLPHYQPPQNSQNFFGNCTPPQMDKEAPDNASKWLVGVIAFCMLPMQGFKILNTMPKISYFHMSSHELVGLLHYSHKDLITVYF